MINIQNISDAEEALNLPNTYTLEDVHLSYRNLIKQVHPDAKQKSSNTEQAARINAAYSFMRKELKGMKPGETRRRATQTSSSSHVHYPTGTQHPASSYTTSSSREASAQSDFPISVNSQGWWHEYAWAASNDPFWFRSAMWTAEHFPWTLIIFLIMLATVPSNGGALFFHIVALVLFAIIGWIFRRPIHDFIERLVAFPFKLIYRFTSKKIKQ